MTDVYQAPEAELTEFSNTEEYGSIEKAVLGEYEFNIGDVLNEAWEKIKGNKGNFILCGIVYWLALAGLTLITSIPAFMGIQSGLASVVIEIGVQIIYYLVSLPLGMGLGFIGVRIAMGASFSPGNLFDFFPKTLNLFFAYLIMIICIILGYLLLILPGIYLSVAYAFTLYLVADKDIHLWQAMEVSRKAVTKRWWAFLGFFFVLGFIVMAGFMALLIGLIWAAPLAAVAWGIAYRNMFGVEAQTLAKQ